MRRLDKGREQKNAHHDDLHRDALAHSEEKDPPSQELGEVMGELQARHDLRSPFLDKRYRRRWFLNRMRRSQPSIGNDLRSLMDLARRPIVLPLASIFADEPYAVVGGVATAAYQPERHTQDIDVLVDVASLQTIRKRLRELGAKLAGELAFPASQLDLRGETWKLAEHPPLDLMWSDAPWAVEATQQTHHDTSGSRIVPLPYLVLMKMDASRGVDQGDLSRMLGLANDTTLEAVRTIIARHMPDAIEDLESYIEIGRIEVGTRE